MAVELCSPRAENARLLWRLASEQHIDQRSPVGNHRVDEMARLGVELGKQRRDPAAEMCSAHSYRGGCANGTGSRRQRNPSGTVLAPVAVGPRPQSALSSPPAALLAAAVYPSAMPTTPRLTLATLALLLPAGCFASDGLKSTLTGPSKAGPQRSWTVARFSVTRRGRSRDR